MARKRKKFSPLKKATKSNVNKLPESPGVYGLFSDNGKLIYVGKVKKNRLSERIEEHKDRGKVSFEKVGFIPTKSQEDALRLEKALIKKRQPKHNKEGK